MKTTHHIFLLLFLVFWGVWGISFAQTNAKKEEYILQQVFELGQKKPYGAVFSPESLFIATLSNTHELAIWNRVTGKLVKSFSTGTHQAISLAYHPKQPFLVTGGTDHTIRLWDIHQGTQSGVLRGHIGKVNALGFNSEGTTLISGSDDGTLLVWDFSKRVLWKTLQKGHKGAIYSLALHPNQQLIASGGQDQQIQIWDIETGKKVVEFQQQTGTITALAFDPSGKFLASGSQDQKIKLWNWREQFAEMAFVGHGGAIHHLSFHPNGIWLASAGADATLRLWNINNGKEFFSFKPVASPVISAHFDPSGQRLVATLAKGNAQLWELKPSYFLASLRGHERFITSLEFTKNGKYLLSSALDKTIKIWNIAEQTIMASYPTPYRVNEVRLSPNNLSFATAEEDPEIGLWITQSGERMGALKQHHGKVNTIDYHPTEPVLLSGGSDQKWILWNLNKKQAIKKNTSHKGQVTVVRFASLGNVFATGGVDQSIQVWDYPNGQLLQTLNQNQQPIHDLAFNPPNTILAAAVGNTIKLWQLDSQGKWKHQHSLKGHQLRVIGVAFSQDGKVLISASQDATVRLWDVKTGKLIQILSGEQRPISAFAIRKDKQVMALGTEDNEVVLLKYPLKADFLEMEQRALKSQTRESPSKTLATLQQKLNALLQKEEVCQDASELERGALGVLQLEPKDLAAYHALLKTAIVRQDINMMFLLVNIGQWASFFDNQYTYAQAFDVQNTFNYWLRRVFSQFQIRQGNSVTLSIHDCQKKWKQLGINENLRYLDIPNEFLEKVVSIPRFIDLRNFQNLPFNEFKNRLLNQVQKKMTSTQPNPKNQKPLSPDFQTPLIPTGQLLVNLEQTQTWGNPKYVLFQLREKNHPWQSYFTVGDRKRMLFLPTGQYFLKVGKTIRRAFTLQPNQTLMLKVTDLQ